MTNTYYRDQIVAAVTESFIATGKYLSIKEIAAAASLNESRIRKVMNDDYGCPDALDFAWDSRPAYSTQYANIIVGHKKVATYAPSRRHLASIIKTLRQTKELEQS